MIYFDNSATTLIKPKTVIDTALDGIKKYTANPGRSSHTPAQNCAMQIYYVRQKVAKFFNVASDENVIFTKNCTEALNIAIFGSVKVGGHVITSIYEHNSVLRPLHKLQADGLIELTILKPNDSGQITIEDLQKNVKPNTYMVVINHISNVTGTKQDIENIGSFCKMHDLLFLVDCAQSAGHEIIDMQKNNISYLCFAGHKGLFALTGSGGLVVNTKKTLFPLILGGTGTSSNSPVQPNDIPEAFESGTLSVLPILTLGAGIDFVSQNFDIIRQQEKKLNNYLFEKLSSLDFLTKYFDPNTMSVFSFNIKGMDSRQVANILNDDFSICVRSGLHCAPLIHNHLHTDKTGAVRVSISAFNKLNEVDELIHALEMIYYQHKNNL